MGYAFTFPVVRLLSLGRIPVGAYVHYPTISTSMLARVRARRGSYANAEAISRSAVLSTAKLVYYRAFMYVYAAALRQAALVMCNSSWTRGHVDGILGYKDGVLDAVCSVFGLVGKLVPEVMAEGHVPPRAAQTVYPPCETQELVGFPLEGREKLLVSVAQFRLVIIPSSPIALCLEQTDQRRTTQPNYAPLLNYSKLILNTARVSG